MNQKKRTYVEYKDKSFYYDYETKRKKDYDGVLPDYIEEYLEKQKMPKKIYNKKKFKKFYEESFNFA